MEHVGYLREHVQLVLGLGVLLAVQGEGMDAERGGEIYLVVLGRVDGVGGAQVAVEDALRGRDEVHAGDRCGAGDDGGRARGAPHGEEGRGAAGEGEGGRRARGIVVGGGGRGGGDPLLVHGGGSWLRTRRTAPPAGFLVAQRLLLVVAKEVGGARTSLRGGGLEADDGAIDGAAPPCVVPVLWPVVLDGAAGLADVFEVGSTEVLVLLDVEPKVEYVLCTLALQE